MASMVRFDDRRILFANPDNLTRADGKSGEQYRKADRKNLSIRLSSDEGKTWPVMRSLEPGGSSYSDLAVLPDRTILCFYLRGYAPVPESGGPSLSALALATIQSRLDPRKAPCRESLGPVTYCD